MILRLFFIIPRGMTTSHPYLKYTTSQDIRKENNSVLFYQKYKIKLYYDRQSVGQSVMGLSTNLGPSTNFPLLYSVLTIVGFLMWGVHPEERMDL
jgi:hypothetical protein